MAAPTKRHTAGASRSNRSLLNVGTTGGPIDYDFRGRELEPGIAAEIVELDTREMRNCDVLLVNAPRPSWGTAMAIYIGWSLGKRVIVVHPEGTTPSPWVVYHASEIHYGSVVVIAETL